jgi:hypothetical protein
MSYVCCHHAYGNAKVKSMNLILELEICQGQFHAFDFPSNEFCANLKVVSDVPLL